LEFRRVLFRSRAPPRHSHGDPTSLAPHERLTDLAVVPREKPHTGAAAREQPRDSPVIERRGPSSPAWPRDQSRHLSPNASGGLTPWSPPSELQEIPAVKNEISRFVLMPIGSFLCSESNCRLVLFAKIPVASPRSKIVKKKTGTEFLLPVSPFA